MEEGIEEPTQFRFTMDCEFGNEDTTASFEVDLNPAEDCYCEPEYSMGCDDGDAINQMIIENSEGEVVFQNDSGCSETGYIDYTEEIEAPELLQGETYTMIITSETEYAEDDNVRVWLDYNQDGFFADEEEIGNTQDEGLNEEGVLSFEFNIPEDMDAGTYRVRARMVWLGGDEIDPCESKSYGETEDYAVEVVAELGVDNTVFNQFEFYPNPIENQLNLNAGTPIEEVRVFNMIGQEVLQISPNKTQTQIDTQSLPTGVYLMKVSLEGVQKTYKLIKK